MGGDSNIWMWIATQLIGAAAIWGAIRADIKAMHARIERNEKSLDDAHSRIDKILMERGH
jgi:hypothetical protein